MASSSPSPAEASNLSFTTAISRKSLPSLPQTIGHRGYNARFPENTMASFAGAVAAGVHAIETDIHLTRDGEVVLSHDATLSRCFGVKGKIIDVDWEYVKGLRTLKEPQERMPRLVELLEWLADEEREDIWILLDIKVDNDTETVMRSLGEVIASVKASPSRPWTERVVLGLWSVRHLPYAEKYLPGFPIVHIGFSFRYARQFFAVAGAGFNMLCDALLLPWAGGFLRQAKEAKRPVFAWTVNDPGKMEWCIRKGLDGVITDDPELFKKICDRYDEARPARWFSIRTIYMVAKMWFLMFFYGRVFYKKIDKPKPPVVTEGEGNTQAGTAGP